MRSGKGSYSEPGADLVQVHMQLHRSTKMAMQFSDDGDEDKAKWLPRSQITATPVEGSGTEYYVTMPEWLAKKNDLI